MFHWLAQLADGSRLDASEETTLGLDQLFDTRDDAEAWLGEYWADLGDYDIAEVSLFEGDALVFGPMGLDE